MLNKRLELRLSEETAKQLEQLSRDIETDKSTVIRRLINYAYEKRVLMPLLK